MNPVIPDSLTVLIPLIVTALSHRLRSDKLPDYDNAAIAGGAMLILAVACVWLSNLWTSDLRSLTTLILAYFGLLAANEFRVILAWLLVSDSPIASKRQPPRNISQKTMPLKSV